MQQNFLNIYNDGDNNDASNIVTIDAISLFFKLYNSVIIENMHSFLPCKKVIEKQ